MSQPTSCSNFLDFNNMSKTKKTVEDARETNNPCLDLCDRGISSIELEIPAVLSMNNVTRLTLSHNKIKNIPPSIANLPNLETLNLFNNCIADIPTSLSSMTKLKILNLGMNRLYGLPRGFGSFPQLEILDLTYNNLTDKSFPGNFFIMETLRALYLSDNDLQHVPVEIAQLKSLQILALRDNDLVSLPKEIGDLARLRELLISGNRLTVLPPDIGNLDLAGTNRQLKMDNNPWVRPIADQLQLGVSHVLDYIKTETYKYLYGRHSTSGAPSQPIPNDKTKKISRKRDHN